MEDIIFKKPTIDSKVIFRARDSYSYFGLDLTLACEVPGTNKIIVGKFLVEEQERYAPITPCLNLEKEDLQLLVDDLWTAGIRPRAGIGSAGQLDAVQAHLNDMRDLVFKYALPHTSKKKGGL